MIGGLQGDISEERRSFFSMMSGSFMGEETLGFMWSSAFRNTEADHSFDTLTLVPSITFRDFIILGPFLECFKIRKDNDFIDFYLHLLKA